MKLKDILNFIFQIRNKEGYKIVTIFGKPVKLKSTSAMLKHLQKENDRLKSNIYAMKFIMDCSLDITKCKKATGYIRLAQTTRLNVLKVVVKIFEKNNIEYWLDGGTALGVYRHKGFVPWDDDIDMVVPRKDYLKALSVLNEEFVGTEFFASIGGYIHGVKHSQWLKVFDKHSNFVYVDIFPYDFCNNPDISKEELLIKLKQLQNKIYTNSFKNKLYDGKHKIEDFMPMILNEYKKYGITVDNGKNRFMFHSIDSMSKFNKQTIQKTEDIYPLKRAMFEDLEANVPNNLLGFLEAINEGGYGDIMAFPPLDVMKVHMKKFDFEKINKKLKLSTDLLKKYE